MSDHDLSGTAPHLDAFDGAPLKAPYPWFGGKSRIASLVWERFGDVVNYIEPFHGSGAVLLSRPHAPRIETVNDIDCYVANFVRAVQAEPETVAHYADGAVNECDLHARHKWLVSRAEFRARMRSEPDYYDAKIAGWWIWGLCAWIGSGWCNVERVESGRDDGCRPFLSGGTGDAPHHGNGVHAMAMREPHQKRPVLAGGSGSGEGAHHGRGVDAASMRVPSEQLPHLGDAGMGIHARVSRAPSEQLIHLGNSGVDTHAAVARSPSEQLPHLGNRGRGGHRAPCEQLPSIAGSTNERGSYANHGKGVHALAVRGETAPNRTALYDMFDRLAARLRYVRVACGDWSRVVTDSVTWRHGVTGIFLDPPYSTEERTDGLYAQDSGTVAAEVRAWCLEHGADKRLKIALCGYAGEGHEALEEAGWSVVAWKAHGGYGGQNKDGENANAHRERIWFSPECIPALTKAKRQKVGASTPTLPGL